MSCLSRHRQPEGSGALLTGRSPDAAFVPLSALGVVLPPGMELARPLPEGFVKGTGMFDVEVCDDDE